MVNNTKIIVAILLVEGKILKADLMDGTIVSQGDMHNDILIQGINYKVIIDDNEYPLELNRITHEISEPPVHELEKINTLV